MKHCELLAALLFSSFIPSIRAAAWEVCYPSRYEGQRFDVATRTTSFFAIDYVESRLLVTHSPAGDSFDIFDFGNDYLHRFRGGNCTTAHYESTGYLKRCLHDEFNLPDLPLGEVDRSLDVRLTGYRIPNCNTSRVIMSTEHDGVALPFFEHEQHDDGSSQTTFFYRVSPSLSCFNYNLYSDVSECVHLNWALGGNAV